MRVVGQQRTWFQPFTPYATHLGSGNKAGIPLVAPPVQQVSTGTLNAGSTSTGTPGTAQSFTVEGASLLGDIVVVGSDNIEVSLSSGSGYGSSVSVSPSGGTVSATTIYARIKSTAPEGSIAETVYTTSSGAAGYAIACSGTVTAGGGPAFPSTGLVAYWGFDDSLTDSVGSKVLTASGGNSYVTGKLGTKALQLTSGNSVDTTNSTVCGYFAGACSLAMWFKAADVSTNPLLVETADLTIQYLSGNPGISVAHDINNLGGFVDLTVSLSNDTWFFVCITSDGGTNPPTLYCNGSSQAGGTSSPLVTSIADFIMSSTNNTTTTTLDGVAIWNVALNSTQVAAVYNSGNGNSPA